MNKKAFTTTEVLAVITILGLIAIILTPIVTKIVSNSKEAAFKQSIQYINKASENYIRSYELENGDSPSYPITFTCDGTSCKTSNNIVLSISGNTPTSGNIIIDSINQIYFDKISDGTYYASGYLSDLVVTKDVTELSNLTKNKINAYTLITEQNNYNMTSKIENLGVPLSTKYSGSTTNDILSRIVWDMKLYNNKIYIGSGDYDKNTGPVDLYYYDLNTKSFVKDTTLNEEQINRFKIVNNKLVIPGIDYHESGDPADLWERGYYYELNGNNWVPKSIPNAIHTFDVEYYKGQIFVGIGNDSDSSILKSIDNGSTFSYVNIYDTSNNLIVDTESNSSTTRVYDLYVYNNKLYALSNQKIFEYDDTDNSFKQINTNYSFAYGLAPGLIYSFPLKEKLQYKDKMVYVHGNLSYTTDITSFPTFITYDKTSYVHDILVYDDTLYALCNTLYDGKIYVSVFKSNDAVRWNPVMYIEYTDMATSFEFDGESFYFGIGAVYGYVYDTNTNSATYYEAYTGPNSGRILKVNTK